MQKLFHWFPLPLCEVTWKNQLMICISFNWPIWFWVPIGPNDTHYSPIWWRDFGASQGIIEKKWYDFIDYKNKSTRQSVSLSLSTLSVKVRTNENKVSEITLGRRTKEHELCKAILGRRTKEHELCKAILATIFSVTDFHRGIAFIHLSDLLSKKKTLMNGILEEMLPNKLTRCSVVCARSN